jgi:hypothetical protein
VLITLSGVQERTLVSIVSYYRRFEPISRAMIKECTKPTAIESQFTKSFSDLRASFRHQVEKEKREKREGKKEKGENEGEGKGREREREEEKREEKESGQYGKQQMRQLSDLLAYVSDLCETFQQQFPERERVCEFVCFRFSLCASSCFMHVLMFVTCIMRELANFIVLPIGSRCTHACLLVHS